MAITVVAFLVGCAPGLMACETIPTDRLAFRDAGQCRSELPALIASYRDRRADLPVVMGKCRYLMDDPEQAPNLREYRRQLLS